jgi:enoyl-CoA hydratase/carnithine racemase
MTTGDVVVERSGAIARVTLSRPAAMNALSGALVASMREAIAALRDDPAVRAVVLTGAGDRAFCAGADLKERIAMTLDGTRGFLHELNDMVDALAAFPRPVIAALNGIAFGGGLELALACDLRLAAEGIEMGLPEVRLGIIPGAGGTQRLARVVGAGVAKELILTGRRIDAARAHAIGLVSALVPRDRLVAEAERWAGEIAEAGPLAVATAKRAIDEGWGKPLADALDIERAAYEVVLASDDRNEGLAAFGEKRKPRFTGK